MWVLYKKFKPKKHNMNFYTKKIFKQGINNPSTQP